MANIVRYRFIRNGEVVRSHTYGVSKSASALARVARLKRAISARWIAAEVDLKTFHNGFDAEWLLGDVTIRYGLYVVEDMPKQPTKAQQAAALISSRLLTYRIGGLESGIAQIIEEIYPERRDVLEDCRDTERVAAIKTLPKMPQVQYDTVSQLQLLSMVAVRLGLYDADDILRRILDKETKRG